MNRIEEIRLQQHLAATGTILVFLLAEYFKASGDADAASARLFQIAALAGEQMTFDRLDPAQSDLSAQEFRDAFERILRRALALATGRPFDPGRS